MSGDDAVKIAKYNARATAKAHKRDVDLALINIVNSWGVAIINSPAAQLIGSIVLAEKLEEKGYLSSGMTGLVEGGVIGMTALLAAERAGLAGSIAQLGSMGIGGLLGTFGSGASNDPLINLLQSPASLFRSTLPVGK